MDGWLSLAEGFVASPLRFLWHGGTGTAVAADLHIGGEGELARQGIYLPAVTEGKLRERWGAMAEFLAGAARATRLVLAGDVFDVAEPAEEAINFFRELLGQLPAECAVTITPGNHDPGKEILAAIADGFNVAVEEVAEVGGYAVFHGHESAGALVGASGRGGKKGGERSVRLGMIVGHQHPAVMLATRVQSAKMICFVRAMVRAGDVTRQLIVLPAFSSLPLGSDMRMARHWILDMPRPADRDIRIAGIIEGPGGAGRVLDFGELEALGALAGA